MKFRLCGTGVRRYTRRHLRHDRDAARAEVLRLEAVIRERDTAVNDRDQRIAGLEADAVDVSVERQLRLLAEDKAEDFERRFLALKSRIDNDHAVTVPPMHRDIDPDETPTEPHGIPVFTLPAALNPSAA